MRNFHREHALRISVGEDTLSPDCSFQLVVPTGKAFSFCQCLGAVEIDDARGTFVAIEQFSVVPYELVEVVIVTWSALEPDVPITPLPDRNHEDAATRVCLGDPQTN